MRKLLSTVNNVISSKSDTVSTTVTITIGSLGGVVLYVRNCQRGDGTMDEVGLQV